MPNDLLVKHRDGPSGRKAETVEDILGFALDARVHSRGNGGGFDHGFVC